MLLNIEKKGRRWVITNNPPIKYRKFAIQINESDIVPNEEEIEDQQKESINFQEIMEIRNKYPQLKAIDQMTSDWIVNDSDKNLLEDYFKQRAEDEGII